MKRGLIERIQGIEKQMKYNKGKSPPGRTRKIPLLISDLASQFLVSSISYIFSIEHLPLS